MEEEVFVPTVLVDNLEELDVYKKVDFRICNCQPILTSKVTCQDMLLSITYILSLTHLPTSDTETAISVSGLNS